MAGTWAGTRRRVAAIASAVLVGASLTAVAATPAGAGGVTPMTFVVDAEGGAQPNDCITPVVNSCSLRDAVDAANGNPAVEDTILFGISTQITLTSPLNISDDLVIGGTADDSFVSEPGQLIIDGNDTGSVFSVTAGADLTISEVTINDGLDNQGGGINATEAPGDPADITVTDVVFDSNQTNAQGGGAIFVQGGTVTVVDSTFTANTATTSGGAIKVQAGANPVAVDVQGASSFGGNTAGFGGGAIDASGIAGGPVTVSGETLFSANTTTNGSGGAIQAVGQTVGVTGGADFTSNSAGGDTGHGGCIDAGATGTITVELPTVGTPSVFTTNHGHSTVEGGGCLRGGTVSVSGATFTGNTTSAGLGPSVGSPGGAISSHVAMTVSQSTFDGNTSDEGGGALYAAAGDVTVTGGSFTNNQSTGAQGGGAIFYNVDDGWLQVYGASFTSNDATTDVTNASGGAIRHADGRLTVSTSTFVGNTALVDGGAIWAEPDGDDLGENASISDSTFTTNSANEGGAIMAAGIGGGQFGNVVIDRSTITANTGTSGAGAIQTKADASAQVTNSTLHENVAPAGTGAALFHGSTNPVHFNFVTVYQSAANAVAVEESPSDNDGFLNLNNSIIASEGTGGVTCQGGEIGGEQTYSVENLDDCGFDLSPSQAKGNVDIQLDPLGDYGGDTVTMRPKFGPGVNTDVVEVIPAADCTAVNHDQRGLDRPGDFPYQDSCTVGAVERQEQAVTGSVLDLAAPLGTGAPWAPGLAFEDVWRAGVGICPSATPGCDPTGLDFYVANVNGIFTVYPEYPGDYVAYPFYCDAAPFDSGTCDFGDPDQLRVPAGSGLPFTVDDEETLNLNFAAGFRPDVQAKKTTTAAIYDADMYDAIATPTPTQGVAKNKSKTFDVILQNDGTFVDEMRIKAKAGGSATMATTYKEKNGPSIPGATMTGAGKVFTIQPGASTTIQVTVKANATSKKGHFKTVLLTATAAGPVPGAKTDQVKVKVSRT